MSDSMRQRALSAPVHSLDRAGRLDDELGAARPTPAKATLDRPSQSISAAAVVKDALLDHHGKLETAAREMKNMDPSQLSRELTSGKLNLARLDALDEDAKAAVADALHEQWGRSRD